MAIRKISPRDASLARIMEQRSAAVRKSVKHTIRQAEEHARRAERIISQSIAVIERAEKIMKQAGEKREHRRERQTRDGHGDSSSGARPSGKRRFLR